MKESVPSVPLQGFWRMCAFCFATVFFSLLATSIQAQPVLIDQLTPGSRHFTAINGNLYFAAGDTLYVYDGEDEGARVITNVGETITSISRFSPGGNIVFLTESGDQQSLWVSDGESSATNTGTHDRIIPLLVHQGILYLRLDDGTHGLELWKLSGSSLTMVKDFNPGAAHGLVGAVVSNNTLYLSANSGGDSSDFWISDGTTASTVKAFEMPFEGHFYNLIDLDGTIFFTRDSLDDWYGETHVYLWKTQGTLETTELVEYFPPNQYYNNLYYFNVMNGKLYFFRDWSIPDHFLWVSDGTEEGTYEIKRVQRDGGVTDVSKVGDHHLAYYTQSQSFPGPIEVSDGTLAGTRPIYRLNMHYTYHNPPFDNVDLTGTEDYLYFIDHTSDSYNDPPSADQEFQIFQSDLTAEGTVALVDLYGISFRGSDNITAAGENTIYFTTNDPINGFRLWFYDPSNICSGAGGILRSVWNNVNGSSTEQIPVNTPPSSQEVLNSFSGPVNSGDKYGAMYRAYLCIPETGDYRFWIASNDYSELWFSTTANPEDKEKIAFVNGATNPGQYNKYASQQSSLIHLEKGRLYYIEALHKEGVGSDHLSVGMQYPDGTLERPILGARLIPFSDNIAPQVTLTSPADGETLTGESITIEATASDSDGSIARVEFWGRVEWSNMQKLGEDTYPPYSLTWGPGLPPASYDLMVKAVDNEGLVTESETITITLTGCEATGNILWEIFPGYPGSRLSDVPFETSDPFSIDYLTIFEGPTNMGDHYGSRIRGYVCPPVSGNYTFYIASNDHSELWLSDTGDPINKIKIASVTGSTNPRQWTKFTSQRSASIYLMKGRKIYIEALHKEGVGSDHLAVGWVLPDGTQEMPIPGSRLAPFETWGTDGMARARTEETVLIADPEVATEITVTPNPSKRAPVTLSLSGYHDGDNGDNVTIDIVSMLGQRINNATITCNGDCSSINIDATTNLAPGVYIIKGQVNNNRFSERLIIQE